MMGIDGVKGAVPLSWTVGDDGAVALRCAGWAGFSIDFDSPEVTIDGAKRSPLDATVRRAPGGTGPAELVSWRFDGGIVLELASSEQDGGRRFDVAITTGEKAVELNSIVLFRASGRSCRLGSDDRFLRILTESGYSSRVRNLDELTGTTGPDGATPTSPDGSGDDREPNTETVVEPWDSRGHWLVFDRIARRGFLIGFLTAERWEGAVRLAPSRPGYSLEVGFDGGDTILPARTKVAVESSLVLAGSDPFALLDTYAAATAARHGVRVEGDPPVSWCSWYPYRLSVSADRVLANARVAVPRLSELGLSIIEADLGWEREYLPSAYEENDQFADGLGAVARELQGLGFELGVWKAPFTVSEFDPIAREHPEWLVCDESGAPLSYWTWFWSPHGAVHILDLTVAGARDYLRDQMTRLHEKGVRYFKPDFISCARSAVARKRHDRTIVAGGGTQMSRIGAAIINEALRGSPVLNCGGPDIPGSGSFPLLYACNDTGNTGYLSLEFMRDNYHALACHLFKNRVWGYLQPSCLCVGLPGSVEEARLRATVAWLTGGQIDISDDLTTLPEDRWRIITASLPTAPATARAIDLFDPLPDPGSVDYTASCAKNDDSAPATSAASAASGQLRRVPELDAGVVWRLPVSTPREEWVIVALLSFRADVISSFDIPVHLIVADPTKSYVAYEFWSGAYLGELGERRVNPVGTDHPGDTQELLVAPAAAAVDSGATIAVRFFGPGVKLLAIRRRRNHPFIVGTSFHQSSGLEIADCTWDAGRSRLAFSVDRPAGETGMVVIDPAGRSVESVLVGANETRWRPGARGSIVIDVLPRVPVIVDFADCEKE